MRTYNIKFNENHIGNKFNFNANKDGFRAMRKYLIMSFGKKMGIYSLSDLIDFCDTLNEINIGDTRYMCISEFALYDESNIEKFNGVVEMMEKASRENLGEGYMPNEFSGVRIKRTEKRWILSTLWYDIV